MTHSVVTREVSNDEGEHEDFGRGCEERREDRRREGVIEVLMMEELVW